MVTDDTGTAGNLGYSVSSNTFDAASLGASVGYQLNTDVRLPTEIWGVDFVADGASTGILNWRAGVEWALTGRVNILAAMGGGIWSQLDAADRLHYDFYIGLQYVAGD